MTVDALATSEVVRMLRRALPGELVLEPADPRYATATTPHNSSFVQGPAAVVQPRTPEQAAAVVAVARQAGRRVVVQATGHGSGTTVNEDVLLLDTSRLDRVIVNPGTRTASVGAGVTWAPVQQAVEPYGLLALSGTSPTVASPATPSPEASVGWPGPMVSRRDRFGPSSTSTEKGSAARSRGRRAPRRPRGTVGLPRRRPRGARHRPRDRPASPRRPVGGVTVHLSYATTGPADAATLAAIHLDPPGGVPARGDGWWVDAPATDMVVALFGAARVGEARGLTMIELRHVATAAPAREGALSRPPAASLLHTVAAAPDDTARARVDDAVAEVAAAAAPAGLGRAVPSFREGHPDAGPAFDGRTSARLTAVAKALDPDRVFGFQRGLLR